jgi:DNA-binding transcriptional LysR family regulator
LSARDSLDTEAEQLPGRQGGFARAIELRHLRYFVTVYDELHFGRAAARLHMAQPPLSQAVRKLEAELGVQLLERTSRVVTPTPAGEAFAAEARKALAAVETAIAAARRAAESGSSFRIGCSPYMPIELLLELLGALDVRLPDLRADVTHTPATDQLARLRTGELDLGIVPNAGSWDGIELEPVFAGQPLSFYVQADHRLAGKERVTPADVEGETLVLFPRDVNAPLHDRILALLSEHGFRFVDVRQAAGSSIREFVLSVLGGSGISVSFFSHREVSEAGTTVVPLALDPPVQGPELMLAWRSDPPQDLRPALDAVREVARVLRRRGN